MTLSRLIYASQRQPAEPLSIRDIIAVSRRRNSAADVTGFLFFDGERFAQVLEGPDASIRDAFQRIRRDARHRNIMLMSCEPIDVRQFGYWSMGLHEGMDEATRGYLLKAFSLRQCDIGQLGSDNMLQFLARLARIARKLDEVDALLAAKC